MAFWALSILLLTTWYVFLQVKNNGFSALNQGAKFLPISQETKSDLQGILSFGEYFLKEDDVNRTFLLLFQNNWELRPGGGFIGSFGILTIKNGYVETIQVHDTGNFDGRIPSTIDPPYPMEETLYIDSWKFRDSNYSPDFAENAEQAILFYRLGGGEEQIDGVVGITTNVLLALLDVTGPVSVEGYPGVYDNETAVMTLEHQVEQGFIDQGIEKGDRKDIMNDLAWAILDKLKPLDINKKIRLAKVTLERLKTKDIQLYFENDSLQDIVEENNWGGRVDDRWQNDYLLVVDANLGSYKSDPYVKRSVTYNADLSAQQPTITLTLDYSHTAKEKNWLINHYTSYTRVYVPEGAWLESSDGVEEVRFGDEFGKKYFGFLVKVPIQGEKTVRLVYTLPETISSEWHDVKIQRQAGQEGVPYDVTVLKPDGAQKHYEFNLSADMMLSEFDS